MIEPKSCESKQCCKFEIFLSLPGGRSWNKEKFSYVEKDTNVYQEVDSKSYQESKDKKIKEKQIKPLEHSVGFYDADGDFEKNKNKIPYTNCN